MRTKFVLHGGFTPGHAQANDAFFSEVLSDAPSQCKVLLVYFAKEADRVPKNREEDIEQFNKNKGQRSLRFEVADEDRFLDQITSSDVVYLHGGKSGKILNTLKKYPKFRESIQGKIVAGDSAGANVLSTVFYSKTLGIAEGLSIIPIKLICHYIEEYENRLQDVYSDLQTILLPEYHFSVILNS